uniref:Uncharacterized protein n=1 Tax=Populus trichocarpa TaxID=3694 RepID=A0A2K1ZTY7_POPTR
MCWLLYREQKEIRNFSFSLRHILILCYAFFFCCFFEDKHDFLFQCFPMSLYFGSRRHNNHFFATFYFSCISVNHL